MGTLALTGKVAVVTGGAKGVGRLIAEEAAAAGAAVAIVGRNAENLEATASSLRSAGATALPLVADVCDRAASAAALDTVTQLLGPVDLLVNNAGIANLGRIVDVDLDFWWQAFEVHLKATMAWCQLVLPQMIERGSGRIVNMTSTAAEWTIPGGSAYTASKAGLSAFTRVLNAEVRSKGVLAFAIAPRLRSDMTDHIQASPVMSNAFRAAAAQQTDAQLERQRQRTIALVRRVITGELDDHAGEHLETEAPPD